MRSRYAFAAFIVLVVSIPVFMFVPLIYLYAVLLTRGYFPIIYPLLIMGLAIKGLIDIKNKKYTGKFYAWFSLIASAIIFLIFLIAITRNILYGCGAPFCFGF